MDTTLESAGERINRDATSVVNVTNVNDGTSNHAVAAEVLSSPVTGLGCAMRSIGRHSTGPR